LWRNLDEKVNCNFSFPGFAHLGLAACNPSEQAAPRPIVTQPTGIIAEVA
jgi:hypothetical protein